MSAIRVELGGGEIPRPGFVNVDQIGTADIQMDLQRVCDGHDHLPWNDDTVAEVYSSHCLEHLTRFKGLLWEICRICKLGAPVEIRVPHWNQSMACCDGHLHTFSETQVRHFVKDFVPAWWRGSSKRLELSKVEKIAGEQFMRAMRLFSRVGLAREDVLDLIPDACHEVRFFFQVIANG